MSLLKDRIIILLTAQPGLTDREITDHIRGNSFDQQPINDACRRLAKAGILLRTKKNGLIRNFLIENPTLIPQRHASVDHSVTNEDQIKEHINAWLQSDGWESTTAWGKSRGVDILAVRGEQRWVIEVKGPAKSPPMRVNYFLAVLGEILQRMDDPATRYSVAFPDMKQYRGLWERLPFLAKQRTSISVLFVDDFGNVDHIQ